MRNLFGREREGEKEYEGTRPGDQFEAAQKRLSLVPFGQKKGRRGELAYAHILQAHDKLACQPALKVSLEHEHNKRERERHTLECAWYCPYACHMYLWCACKMGAWTWGFV